MSRRREWSLRMRGRGINYDTGFFPGGRNTRAQFDPAIVGREMQIIATELHCTAVRISGGNPERLSIAGELAAAAGLEVWFAPFPSELSLTELGQVLAGSADRAERLRQAGAEVVLVTGCEISLFNSGILPGGTVYERITGLTSWSPQMGAAFGAMPGRLNEFLAAVVADARGRFGGRITYASGTWEPVDWAPFDIVAADAYRDAGNAAGYAASLDKLVQHGKPAAITEFGCCTYAGAADRGGMGWAIMADDADPPRLQGDYARDEDEQVRYLSELLPAFAAAGVDSAFWFTFAGYGLAHHEEPRADLDMASYGVVKMLPGGPGTGREGLGWEPKRSFAALARAYQALEAGTRGAPVT
jgi:hypothetical protein